MMKQYKTRAQLKQEVKDLYRGNWLTAIKLNLVPVILSVIAVVLVVIGVAIASQFGFFDGTAVADLSTDSNSNSGGGSGFQMLGSLITLGILYTSLDWVRTKTAPEKPFRAAFAVFSKRYFLGSILTKLLVTIFTILWTLLLIVPGIIKGYSYSQANFIYKDLEDSHADEISYLDCISKSRELMNGHKWRLFVLQLSFIGWDILAIATCFIGYLWLTPYKNAVYAAFYDDLTKA